MVLSASVGLPDRALCLDFRTAPSGFVHPLRELPAGSPSFVTVGPKECIVSQHKKWLPHLCLILARVREEDGEDSHFVGTRRGTLPQFSIQKRNYLSS